MDYFILPTALRSFVKGVQVVEEGPASPLEIATAVSLSVGLIQVAIGLLRIGSLTAVVSDTIISSFTVGASVHVATSQIR